MKPLTKAQAEKFFDLVSKTGSPRGGTRVIARLQLNAFVEKHGKDACQAIYDAAMTKRSAKRKKK